MKGDAATPSARVAIVADKATQRLANGLVARLTAFDSIAAARVVAAESWYSSEAFLARVDRDELTVPIIAAKSEALESLSRDASAYPVFINPRDVPSWMEERGYYVLESFEDP